MFNFIPIIIIILLLGLASFLVFKRSKYNQFHLDYIIVHVFVIILIICFYVAAKSTSYTDFLFNSINLIHIISLMAFILHVESAIKGYKIKLNLFYMIPILAYTGVSVLNSFDIYIIGFYTKKVDFLMLKILDERYFSDKILTKGLVFLSLISRLIFISKKSIDLSYTVNRKRVYKIWVYSFCFLLTETLIISNLYYFGILNNSFDGSLNLLIRINAILSLVFILLNPSLLYYLPAINQKGVYSRVRKSNFFELIHALMEKEKVYLNPRLTIGEIAIRIGISVKNIRAAISLERGENFNDFVNHYRINYATSLINKKYLDTYTAVALGEKSGFNSHQSFFRAFKKINDTTPALYSNSLNKSR